MTIDNVTIKGGRNSVLFNDPSFAWTGGGIDIFLTGTTAKTVLSNCVITGNTNVHGYGGGINISSLGSGGVQDGVLHGSVEITKCEISNNHELGTPNPSPPSGPDQFGTCGGGICTGFSDNHNVTITDSQISGNSTPGSGGGIGIIMNHGTVAIHNSMIGGAQLPSAGCTDCGNTAGRQGGGINANGLGAQTVIIDQGSVIQNNVAGTSTAALAVGSGGGIQSGNSANSSTTLSKVTIIGNSVSPNAPTQAGGGGILAGGNLTVGFSRIVGNSGGTGGGNGLRVDNGGPGTVIATNNWWGCNDGPSAAPCDTAILDGSGAGSPPATLNFNPWLVLSLGVSPSSVVPNGTSALTADFLNKSDATTVTPADITVLLGLPIAFGATHGAISGAQATIQATGTATATFTHDATCLDDNANATVDTTPGPTVSTAPITVTCPDLTAAKTNNVGGSVPLSAGSWTWTILVANGGAAPANFANGQTILTDTLPGGATIMYGPAGISKVNGISGTILCGITSGVLTCAASGAVAIAAPGFFEVSFTATVSAAGTYANPTGGSCAVDPNDNVPETNEGNNSCNNSVTVVGPPAITPPTLPPGTVGTAYAQLLTATGGAGGPYTFAVSTGALPAGLTLSPEGALGGTPTTPGTFSFTIAATDAAGNSGSQPYTLVVQAASLPITVLPATLPGAVVGVAYAQMLTATGGAGGPYTFAVSTGALPAGLTLSPEGALGGTPTTPGTFSFTIAATDAAGNSGSQPYTLVVQAASLPITVLPATLPGAVVGVAYAQMLTATGGAGAPYTFVVSTGALPAGLTLSPEGALGGTPTTAGAFSFTIAAIDAAGRSGSQPYELAIAPPPITVLPATLPEPMVGVAYAHTLTATGGGGPPYTFAVTAGALPPGLVLSPEGALSGTPTTAGPYAFTVTATDATGATGVLAYSGVVALPPAVPTLPWWALLLLSYLLFHLGVFRLRNRTT